MNEKEFEYWLKQSEKMKEKADVWETLPLESKEFVDCNILRVAVGTTGYKGGDSGHGGRTVFALEGVACTDMRVSINGGEVVSADRIKIIFGGDSEMDTFTKSLLFAAAYMKKKTKPTPWYKKLFTKLN